MGKPLGYYGITATAEDEAAFEALSREELVALLSNITDLLADEFDCKDTDFLEVHDIGGDSVDLAKAVVNRLDEVGNG